jgi:hypothetical protein
MHVVLMTGQPTGWGQGGVDRLLLLVPGETQLVWLARGSLAVSVCWV